MHNKTDRVFKAIMLNNLDILEAIISQAWGEKVKILKVLNPELTMNLYGIMKKIVFDYIIQKFIWQRRKELKKIQLGLLRKC